MRMENDEENFQNTKISSYYTLDLNWNYKLRGYDISLNVNNITNVKYFNYAVSSSNSQGIYNAYPEPERNLYLSIGKSF